MSSATKSKMNCPACGVAFSYPSELAGRSVKCRGCGGPVVLSQPIETVEIPEPPRKGVMEGLRRAAKSVASGSPAPNVTCPLCGGKMVDTSKPTLSIGQQGICALVLVGSLFGGIAVHGGLLIVAAIAFYLAVGRENCWACHRCHHWVNRM